MSKIVCGFYILQNNMLLGSTKRYFDRQYVGLFTILGWGIFFFSDYENSILGVGLWVYIGKILTIYMFIFC